ncbi:Myc-type basic helix-loop-helix (bHLH) domain-containing protein [Dioscorea alata]|uniref:Myc-type basic helix-loop-helix (BHLH) domain-containing protein n=1 Tax=Dioscorea alata TaxID=55571 RepID=A0ACB7VDG7_DIOAL|nr:Myc-type basic helix-loop-helix (bHLH) domain-containing protein [Dioscorea alata]
MEEEKLRRKRRRVCAIEPNELVYASFPSNYISRLLPALVRVTGIASCEANKDEDMEKTVRFEVDMALATSTSCFKWSSALKHQLEQQQQQQGKFDSKTVIIPNPNPRKGIREHKKKKNRGEEELEFRVRALRKIVPGGEEMNACELLTEMESYVVYLQMQVYILKSLVANH